MDFKTQNGVYFIVAICMSLISVIISILGLCNLFSEQNPCVWTTMIGTTVGLWIPTPNLGFPIKGHKPNEDTNSV